MENNSQVAWNNGNANANGGGGGGGANGTGNPKAAGGGKSLRSACDLCHQGKVKCSGGTPCDGCRNLGVDCTYSTSNRTGRPKGVKNKKTVERIKQMRAANGGADPEERPVDSAPSSRQSTRPSSPIMGASRGERGDQISPLTMPRSMVETASSRRSSNVMIPDNTSMQFWNCFQLHDAGHRQPEHDFNAPLSRPHSHDAAVASDSMLFNSMDAPNEFSTDFNWLEQQLTAPDLTLPNPEQRLHQRDSWSSGCDQHSTAALSQPSSLGQSLPQASPFSTCNCVAALTKQLATFKALSRSCHFLRPDFVLTAARDALTGWQSYMQCSSCQHSNDKDILVLSVMALRALLDLIQKAGHQNEERLANDPGYDEPPKDPSSPTGFKNEYSFLGTYQLAGEEKRLVEEMLLQRTLRNLNPTIEHLRQRSLSMAGTSTPGQSSLSNRSSRANTPPPSAYAWSGFLDEMTLSEGLENQLTQAGRALDEHDSYLQGSLQISIATIESLSKTQGGKMMTM